jgi:hypothetical protein
MVSIFKNNDFDSHLELLLNEINKVLNYKLINNILKLYSASKLNTDFKNSGQGTIAINDKISLICRQIKDIYNLETCEIGISPGITHHTDNIGNQYNNLALLIPLLKKQEYYFKYVDINSNTKEHQLYYNERVIFNPKELHSLAPMGMQKTPFTYLLIWS